MPGALLFDLDGTLVDSARDIAAALTAVSLSRAGPPILPETVRPLVSRGAAVLVREALGPHAGAPDDDLIAFRQILAATPPDPDAVYPGAVAALFDLADRGHPLAIVTNKPEGLARTLLAGLGLDRLFGAIVGGDTARFAKPDPAPLLYAVQALGERLHGAVLIGDSEVDARAAAAAGVPFVLFEGGYGAAACAGEPMAARFSDFAALLPILGSITGQAIENRSR